VAWRKQSLTPNIEKQSAKENYSTPQPSAAANHETPAQQKTMPK
jgi:hypothetical protein